MTSNGKQRVHGKKEEGHGVSKRSVQEVPKAKCSKSRETDRTGDVGGIVKRAWECRAERQSSGTQYSNPPSGSLTQPSGSGSARKSGKIWLRVEGWIGTKWDK